MRNKIQKQSLAEQCYHVIKKAIINNELKPNQPLIEEKLASELEISRTPLRRALNQLSFEGLIVMQPGKHAVVSSISDEDFKDHQMIRELLEPKMAELAAKLITQDDIKELRKICRKQIFAIEDDDYHEYLELDRQFHIRLAEITKNKTMKEFISILNSQIQRFLILSNTLHDRAEEAVNEHLLILDELEKHDASGAKKMMEMHIRTVTDGVLKKEETR